MAEYQKKISLLGSTGSIGVSTLDLARQHPDRFQILALAAGSNTRLLLEQIAEFRPRLVSVKSKQDYEEIKAQLSCDTEIFYGDDGAQRVATAEGADLVVSAIVGAAGLKPTLAAIEAGKDVCLANKESMVIAGEIMSQKARQNRVRILPVDSEHSAIFQCLNGEHPDDVDKLILTASGGPFWNLPQSAFIHITREQALKHPNWDMGAKITIDSATMMNKGLEVMEAHWLFGMPVAKINVVVHPQSIIHSMVQFVDGSVMAQMGSPDMRVPIAYALMYPRRITTGVKTLDLPKIEKLSFFEPDLEKFSCLRLAFDVARKGLSYPAVLNAANEVAVDAFLKK
ncbi:MAG TPA: 1-deoxy-D-xylulose-5-phosphate reductoisomerase, partial [bacterium]|nr:1-deoxy-D-xylulose-5-phosphate reductoisomerase [bacterium]